MDPTVSSWNDDPQFQAGNDTVRLGGVDLPLVGDVRATDLNRFQAKVTMGDYSYDSDALLSTWIMASWTAGIGNYNLKEGVDDEAYWTGTLATEWPGLLSLGRKTYTFSGPVTAAGAYPLADFPASAPSLWVMFDTTITRWNETLQTFQMIARTNGSPVNKGIEYNKKLYIPIGNQGYIVVDQWGTVTSYEDLSVQAFCLWDNKLMALTVDGVLRKRYMDQAWDADVPELHLPSGHLPRNLVVYINQGQEPTVHIVTNRDVWAYDPDQNMLHRTQLKYPPHPHQGRASDVWRGEAMYVSVGLGIHSYNGGVIAAMGPDGKDGLPAELRGIVTDLEPEYNGLYALVTGAQVGNADPQDVDLDDRQFNEGIRPFRYTAAYSTLLKFNGYGWHPQWTSPSRGGQSTWAHVSVADNLYRIWWGYDGQMHYQDLPVTFNNPREGLQVGIEHFAPKGSIQTGWFDADMVSFTKTASHFEIMLDDVFEDGTITGKADVYYRTDIDLAWKLLGTADHVGRTVMPFEVRDGVEGGSFSYGLPFRKIQFRVDLSSDNDMMSPIVKYYGMKFIKIPNSGLSWTFTVDLHKKVGFMNWGPQEITDFIRGLAKSNEFCELVHRDRRFRVRVAQTTGTERTGHDPMSTIQVSVVEAPLAANEWKLPDATRTP